MYAYKLLISTINYEVISCLQPASPQCTYTHTHTHTQKKKSYQLPLRMVTPNQWDTVAPGTIIQHCEPVLANPPGEGWCSAAGGAVPCPGWWCGHPRSTPINGHRLQFDICFFSYDQIPIDFTAGWAASPFYTRSLHTCMHTHTTHTNARACTHTSPAELLCMWKMMCRD